MMILSCYELLISDRPKFHMNNPWFHYGFIAGMIAFVEGCLFAWFTYDMFME